MFIHTYSVSTKDVKTLSGQHSNIYTSFLYSSFGIIIKPSKSALRLEIFWKPDFALITFKCYTSNREIYGQPPINRTKPFVTSILDSNANSVLKLNRHAVWIPTSKSECYESSLSVTVAHLANWFSIFLYRARHYKVSASCISIPEWRWSLPLSYSYTRSWHGPSIHPCPTQSHVHEILNATSSTMVSTSARKCLVTGQRSLRRQRVCSSRKTSTQSHLSSNAVYYNFACIYDPYKLL